MLILRPRKVCSIPDWEAHFHVLGLILRTVSHCSWLQIKEVGICSFFIKVLVLGEGPLSLMSTTEELLGRKSSGSGLENRDYGRRDLSR
jgi:hypothetical protein